MLECLQPFLGILDSGSASENLVVGDYVFGDLGYRRYEWKCNSFNAPSRRTALRLGFRFEGVFRNHMVVKGHNRDTAWFSILDNEWPALKTAYEKWLAPENFDRDGRQRMSLSDMIAAAR